MNKQKMPKKSRQRSHIRRVRQRNRAKIKRLKLRNESLGLQHILAKMSPEMLIQITMPIDQAIASFDFSGFIIESPEQLFELLTSLYFHILSCQKRTSTGGQDILSTASETLALLDRAFAREGGYKAAIAQIQYGATGLRLIVEQFAEQFKREEKEKHINHTLKTMFDPMDWKKRTTLMEELLERLKPNLPMEITNLPAERWTEHQELITKFLAQYKNELNSMFRKF